MFTNCTVSFRLDLLFLYLVSVGSVFAKELDDFFVFDLLFKRQPKGLKPSKTLMFLRYLNDIDLGNAEYRLVSNEVKDLIKDAVSYLNCADMTKVDFRNSLKWRKQSQSLPLSSYILTITERFISKSANFSLRRNFMIAFRGQIN